MSRILKVIFFLFVLILGLAFHVKNDQLVNLNYYMGSIHLPVSLLVMSSLLVGALLGIFASLAFIAKLKRENAKLARLIRLTEEEVNNLRAIPIKDVP
ncbi:MAG: LapA family protein [Gammaproteobacteria bacterium]|nr:LapA family protein [Gammaproteobacteria bacterium]MCI0590394.1 LapA family protein [Gammaproteobacteria bacterium]